MIQYWGIFLHASWNYEEIEELIGMGSGGGAQLGIGNPPWRNELGIGDQLRVKSYELRKSEDTKHNELNTLNTLIANDPVMSKLKRSYDKIAKEKSEKVEKQIREYSKKEPNAKVVSEYRQNQILMLTRESEIEKNKQDRAKRNIFESVHMSKEEKLKRRIEDLSFTTILTRNDSENKDITNIPFEYKLSQNYPIRRGGHSIR